MWLEITGSKECTILKPWVLVLKQTSFLCPLILHIHCTTRFLITCNSMKRTFDIMSCQKYFINTTCTEKHLIFRTKLVRTKVRNRHNLQLAAARGALCSVLSGWISCRPSVHRQTLYSGKPFDPAQDQVLLWKEPVKITQVKSLTNPQDTGLQVLSISERIFQMFLVSLFTD